MSQAYGGCVHDADCKENIVKIFSSRKQHWLFASWELIIIFLVIYIVWFTGSLKNTSFAEEESKFISSADVVRLEILDYFDNSTNIVRDWAQLVSKRSWSLEQVVSNIADVNSGSDVSVQAIYADDLTGFSSPAPQDGGRISYDSSFLLSTELVDYISHSHAAGDVLITGPFENYISSEQCIAFVTVINVFDGGKKRDAFLMRVEPLKKLVSSRFAGNVYPKAQVSMINRYGDYIFRSPMLDGENFYGYLRSCNDLTYTQAYDIRDRVNDAGEAGGFIMKNSSGSDVVYACSARGYNDWVVILTIETDDIPVSEVHWSLLIAVIAAFCLLTGINLVYFLSLSRRLKANLAELEKANSAKTRFLSSMSHDIRTPMNAIIGLTKVAEHNIDDKDTVKDCLRKVSLASSHLLTLINDILDISQIESGKFDINPVVFSLSESAEDLVNILYPQAEDKKLMCDVYVSGITQDYLYADKLRLNQIWINIISNAIKYTPEGGKIQIDFLEREIEDKSKIRLVFRVSDTGIGMSPEFLKRIFEPFAREKDNRIDKVQGSGLGMAITKQMVDLLGGTIEVESCEGKGSVFTVTLDIDRAEDPIREKDLDGISVLLVGERSVTDSIKQFLGELGARSEQVDSANEALSAARKMHGCHTDYDLIIIDRKMNSRDCISAASLISRNMGSSAPAMIISAYSRTDIEAEAAKAGVRGFIAKPVFKSVLHDTVRDILFSTDRVEQTDIITETDFSGVHLLVAEDNDINWEIVRELLKMYSIPADRAVNGKECVRMIEEAEPHRYTMIFMDIQMPELNGYGATRAIRSLSDTEKADIPIVAMTADAFASDVAACLDAGMDGHISKPVDIDKMLTEILKHM